MSASMKSQRAKMLEQLDGFRVEVDPDRERADIIPDRPSLNVISMPQRDQLRLVFEELDADDGLRVIVLRAQGEHFSSGGNIKGFLEASPEHVSELADNIAAPARCRKPVVAQIHGSGGSGRLLHMIGIQRTKEMTFRSRRVSGQEAKDWGFVLDCVPDDQLEATVDAFVEELRVFSPLAQRTIKGVLNAAQNATLEAGIEIEGNAGGRLRCSEDFKEGVEAFHAERKAEFRGV